MLRLAILHAASITILLPGIALAQLAEAQGGAGGDPLVIGVAAPFSGPSQILGEQVLAGARAAAEALGEEAPVEIAEADTACSAEGGKRAAQDLAEAGAIVVIGFLCTEALDAALPLLTEAGIPTIIVGVRAGRVTDERERTGHLVWRVAPRFEAQADAVAEAITESWAGEPFGLIDDGSFGGRGLTDAVRIRLEAQGMPPATIDNYRPAEELQFGLVRRLERTGVRRFFIAGDRPDIAIIARDAAEAGLELVIMGGEDLFDEDSEDLSLPSGLLAVAPQNRFGDMAANQAQLAEEQADSPLYDGRQGYYGPSFAATEIAIEAIRKSRAGEGTIPDALNTTAFDTALGTVRFDARGDSDLDLFRVFEWQDNQFVEVPES